MMAESVVISELNIYEVPISFLFLVFVQMLTLGGLDVKYWQVIRIKRYCNGIFPQRCVE